MRISDWSSDVCSSDLYAGRLPSAYIACTAVVYATDSLKKRAPLLLTTIAPGIERSVNSMRARSSPAICIVGPHQASSSRRVAAPIACAAISRRSEEHTSELQSLMRITYAVFCLQKKKNNHRQVNMNTQE